MAPPRGGPPTATSKPTTPGDAYRVRACPVDYDAELSVHNARLRRVYDIGLDDRVIDIGCGTGQAARRGLLVSLRRVT
jgi:hypothetical protein